MLWLLIWAVYGAIVGTFSEWLYKAGPKSWAGTIFIGICGSYAGGILNYLLGRADAISPTGILMGIVGSILCLWVWQTFRLNRIINMRK